MNQLSFLLIFPSLFMIHEMEEIILMPKFVPSKLEKNIIKDFYTPFKFNVVVLEEFLLLLTILMFSIKYNNFMFYDTVIIAYIYHIFVHLFQTLLLKSYSPGLLSGIISSLYCISMMYPYLNHHHYLYLYSLLTLIIIMLNILISFILLKRC